ncbi:hypothetical protein ACRAWD_22555 [Caulobacter segnis]
MAQAETKPILSASSPPPSRSARSPATAPVSSSPGSRAAAEGPSKSPACAIRALFARRPACWAMTDMRARARERPPP